MFGLGKEAPALQAYGKLPLAKDYLRVGAGEGCGREFREWLDLAFSGQTSLGAPIALPWPARFVVAPGASSRNEPLLGTMWPSSDTGGLRRFPFALFVERKRKALVEAVSHGLAGQHAWWEAIERHWSAREQAADGQAFLGALRGKSIEPGAAERDGDGEDVEHVAWQEWTAALWPSAQHATIADALRAVAELARKRAAGPLRLPLVEDLPMVEQAGAWTRALAELGWLERGELPSLLLFPRDGEASGGQAPLPAFLLVSRAPLSPALVAWLTLPAGSAPLASVPSASDLIDGTPRKSRPGALRRGPPLSDSMLGALASFRARS
jgi:type VI secretion system ImpM family protein